MAQASPTYTRGQLAKSSGVKGETIRYYENCGLLMTPARSAAGHRIYTAGHLKQLKFIRRCRELGFPIVGISGLLGLSQSREKTCSQVRHATAEQLSDIQGKIRDLRKMERTLKALVGQCDANISSECPTIGVLFS